MIPIKMMFNRESSVSSLRTYETISLNWRPWPIVCLMIGPEHGQKKLTCRLKGPFNRDILQVAKMAEPEKKRNYIKRKDNGRHCEWS